MTPADIAKLTHAYTYKGDTRDRPWTGYWYCRPCSDLCPPSPDHPTPDRGCIPRPEEKRAGSPCHLCAHRITDEDCPYNQRVLVGAGLIEPIGNIRHADSAADPEHAKDTE